MWLCADEQPTWNLWLYVISGELQYPDCAPGERRSSAGSTEYLLISFFNTQVWQKFGSQLLCVEQLSNASRYVLYSFESLSIWPLSITKTHRESLHPRIIWIHEPKYRSFHGFPVNFLRKTAGILLDLLKAFVFLFLSAWLAIHASARASDNAMHWCWDVTSCPGFSSFIYSEVQLSAFSAAMFGSKPAKKSGISWTAEAAHTICSASCTQHWEGFSEACGKSGVDLKIQELTWQEMRRQRGFFQTWAHPQQPLIVGRGSSHKQYFMLLHVASNIFPYGLLDVFFAISRSPLW